MAVETVKEYREVELDLSAAATVSATFYTEMPNAAMTAVASPTSIFATSGRVAVNFRLPGSAKGKLCKLRLASSGVVRIFRARVCARYLGSNSQWGWFDLPVEQTNELLQITALPIEPTADAFSTLALPIEPTPVNRIWVDVPVDAIA